jgi:3'-phosphoadenosine 5'-phosphosulfate sulfotransferase (PAPS reductase)/FAD synthetase
MALLQQATLGTGTSAGPRLTVLSYGAGQDSWALLLLLARERQMRERFAPRDLVVVFSDTMDEHEETYEHVERTRRFCEAEGIPFVHIKPEMGFHAPSWPGLIEHYERTRTCGSKAFPKTCTDQLKVSPIYRWLEHYLGEKYGVRVGAKQGFYRFARRHGRVRVLIGITSEEAKRRIRPASSQKRWMRETVEVQYPLVELGMDRAACQAAARRLHGFVPPPSNCVRCPFLSEIELVWLHHRHPEKLAEWIRLEAAKVEAWRDRLPPEKNLGVWGRRLLPEVLAGALAKYRHMSLAELDEHKMSHGHCVRSRY